MEKIIFDFDMFADWDDQRKNLETLLDDLDEVGVPGHLAIIGRMKRWDGIRNGYRLEDGSYIGDAIRRLSSDEDLQEIHFDEEGNLIACTSHHDGWGVYTVRYIPEKNADIIDDLDEEGKLNTITLERLTCPLEPLIAKCGIIEAYAV